MKEGVSFHKVEDCALDPSPNRRLLTRSASPFGKLNSPARAGARSQPPPSSISSSPWPVYVFSLSATSGETEAMLYFGSEKAARSQMEPPPRRLLINLFWWSEMSVEMLENWLSCQSAFKRAHTNWTLMTRMLLCLPITMVVVSISIPDVVDYIAHCVPFYWHMIMKSKLTIHPQPNNGICPGPIKFEI